MHRSQLLFIRRAVRIVAAIALLQTLSGCAQLQRLNPFGASDEEVAAIDADLAAQDLVFTLAQIPALHPLRTTVQISTGGADDPFNARVRERIKDAGYGIEEVETDRGVNYLESTTDPSSATTGDATRFKVAIGSVSVSRGYESVDGMTRPSTVQVVRGAGEQDIVLNDDLFGPGASDSALAAVAVDEPADRAGGRPAKSNLHDTLRSNYAPLLAEYDDVAREMIVFGDDSMVLGRSGKASIRALASVLDPETDVLSVIGCSHGKSSIDGGNAVLANGRAYRVKEEFMFAGVAHDQVFEEGCWSVTPFDEVMPRRGVVITLKRRRATS